jgi:hypothetical protein
MNAISNKIVILDSINDFETKPLIIYDSVNNVYDGVFVYAPTSKGSFLQGLSHIRFDDNLNILTKQMVPFANNYYPVKYTNFDNKPVLWGSYEHQSNTSKHLDILEFTDSSDYSKYLSHRVDFNYQMSFTNVIKSRDGGYLISGAITFFDVDSLYSTHGISDYALIKLDKDFNLVWERFWGTSLDENLVWCEEQDNGNIYVVGNRYNYISSDVPHKIYLAEIKNPSTSVDNDPVNNNEAEIIFPSIVTTTSPELKIIAGQSFDGEVFVTDLLGNCIQSAHISSLSNNTNYIRMDFTSMLPGVYFIGIRTGNGLEVRKFIFAP